MGKEWISVDNFMPIEGQDVWCVQNPKTTATRKPLIAIYTEGKFKSRNDTAQRYIVSYWASIIYWKPLIEPTFPYDNYINHGILE